MKAVYAKLNLKYLGKLPSSDGFLHQIYELRSQKRLNRNWRCGRPSVLNAQVIGRVQELRAKGHSIRNIAQMLEISKASVERAIKAAALNPGGNDV
jgi:DNA invertase Pin-like site-specific DNA recombinase